MKISFICDFNPFYTSSAIANRYEGILKGLMQNNVQINLYIIDGYQSVLEYRGEKTRDYPLLKTKYLVPWLNSTLFFRRINKYLLRKVSAFSCNSKFKKILDEKVDYCWIAGGYTIRKYIANYKNIIHSRLLVEFSEYQQLYKDSSNIPTFQMKILENEYNATCDFLKKVDYVLVITKCLEKYYKKLVPKDTKFLHLPMTVDLSRFSNISNTTKYKSPYIAFAGTFNNAKDGVDILIKSFGKISKKYPDIILYMVGPYHYDIEGQKKLISNLSLENKIIYAGTLKKEDIPEFLCNADLLVLPRPDSRQAQGGFPTKLGEYLATGNPVCVTKVGEIPDYLEDNKNAFMATPGDIDSFADAMDRALSDKAYANRIGQNGRKLAEEIFNAEIQSKRLVDFLTENMKNKPNNEF